MAGEIKIEGLPELHRSLDQLDANLRDLTPLHHEIGTTLARAIGANAPRLTGRLASSFEPVASRDKAEATSDVEYAGCQESGVPEHNIEGLHYAEHTLTESAGEIDTQYREGIEKLLRKAET